MTKKLLLPLFLILCHSISAQDLTKDFKTSSISIFKNGTAFFVKSGKVKTEDRAYLVTENLPPALFGTYWVLSPTGELRFLSSQVDTLNTSIEETANTIADMLHANIGKKVKLHIGTTDKEIIEGVIEKVGPWKLPRSRTIIPRIITFKVDGKWLTFNISQVQRIEFFENPNQTFKRENEEVKPVLEVHFLTDKKEQELDMMYLSKGLSWVPIYLIELLDETKARLTLRAEVANGIEDIIDTDVNFVVGVANFSYATKLSTLLDFAGMGFKGNNVQAEMNFHNVQQFTNAYGIQSTSNQIPNLASINEGLEGAAEEDLYFYTLKNMNLKKGARGHFPIFKRDIDISHIYECNLPPNNTNKKSYKQDYLFSVNPNTVIHSIKINNKTNSPFTTGPALVVKQQDETKPISQDRLNYTPINGHSFVKLTEAPDVLISQAEKAISTKKEAKKITKGKHNYSYDLITVEGQVKIKNYKNKKIDLNVKRTIIGDLQKSSVKWLKSERITAAGDLNKMTDVCWETSVDAREELKIIYTYQILLPH